MWLYSTLICINLSVRISASQPCIAPVSEFTYTQKPVLMAKLCRKPADWQIIKKLNAELARFWMHPVCADTSSPGSWHNCHQFDKWRLGLCQPCIMIQQPGAEQECFSEGQRSFKALKGEEQDKMGCRDYVSNLQAHIWKTADLSLLLVSPAGLIQESPTVGSRLYRIAEW